MTITTTPKSLHFIGDLLFDYEIDMVHKVSTNEIYSGVHFSKRSCYKEWYLLYVNLALRHQKWEPVVNRRVHIHFYFTFKDRLFDASNCSYMAKLVEDALKKEGVIKDDSPEYVSAVTLHVTMGLENKIGIKGVDSGELFNYKSARKALQPKRPASRKPKSLKGS